MRIAFTAPEYPTELENAGGLASYIQRMARLLKRSGHTPEVFVSSRHPAATVNDDGVMVHRVNWREQYSALSSVHRLLSPVLRMNAWNSAVPWLLDARAIAVALDRRHRLNPFQLVQSADYLATGLFIPRRHGRQHVVRCSSAADLYNDSDGISTRTEVLRGWLERKSMRRADTVYAPSHYLAEHFRRKHSLYVRVIRPPNFLERTPDSDPGLPLPQRFFIHFGQLRARKGTELLAKALPLAWQRAPCLTMIWSGADGDPEQWNRWRNLWGQHAGQIHATGALSRARLYAILQRAEAAVLPSQVDNLPNTVIESLMFGIPVIGSRGASIDELVEEDITGHLVDLGDEQALADALVRFWHNENTVKKGFVWKSSESLEMNPSKAVENLIALGRGAPHSP